MAYTDASYKASAKYKAEKIKRVPLDMQKADYERLSAAAGTAGKTVNGYIKQAIKLHVKADERGGYLVCISKEDAQASAERQGKTLAEWLAEHQ